MAGVDIRRFRFDFDLTFAVLLMHSDGTVYHTLGGRTWRDAQSHLSLSTLVDLLQQTLVEHEAYVRNPDPPQRQPQLTIEQIPPMAEKIRLGKAPKCFHCHMVHGALHQDRRDAEQFTREDAWIWPDPIQVGLTLDGERQQQVAGTVPQSPADRAGLLPGDELVRLGTQQVLTFGDVQRFLHETSRKPATIPVSWMRAGELQSGRLEVGEGWKSPTPLVFSWRPSKWSLSPKPGFGGQQLKPAELESLGLAPDAFALRVGYIVTWGDNAYTGKNAQRAGIRKGDVITSIADKHDFQSVDHFHAWFRLTQKPDSEVTMQRIRGGERTTIRLPVLP